MAMAPTPVPISAPYTQWKVGDICEALFSEDNVWYRAQVVNPQPNGNYFVTYTEYGNSEEVRHCVLLKKRKQIPLLIISR